MFIQTSHGLSQIDFNKILKKITFYSSDLHFSVDPSLVAQKTIERLADNMTTKQIDELSGGLAANLVNIHPDYAILGARILMDRIHKNLQIPFHFKNKSGYFLEKEEILDNQKLESTKLNLETKIEKKMGEKLEREKYLTFAQHIAKMYNYQINGKKSTRISENVMNFVQKNALELENIVNYARDFEHYTYTALISWVTRGLEKMNKEVCESPSQMFLRVAIGLNVWQDKNPEDLAEFTNFSGFVPEFKIIKNLTDVQRLTRIAEYYELLSTRKLSVSGPVLMHAGSAKNQMASCFLEDCEDSLTGENYPINGKIGGIMKAVTQLAKQSQGGAGTAVALHKIRSNGSIIASSNGSSNGILPFMKMFDATIGAVNQSGKRAGVCTVYLEPWHSDILDFLDSANHFTIEEKRCKNLFFALWMNDLFFERMTKDKGDALWTLFDPDKILSILGKPLSEFYGEEFQEKYLMLERMGIGREIKLMEIWSRICNLFQTTGLPYILNKDEFNRKSNSKNIGVIKSSNVCTEIALPASDKETAVCVLSSVCVSRFVNLEMPDGVDWEGIINAARIATKNLNNVIDLQFYPTPETRNACWSRRAIGISAQGLADLFLCLSLDFDSPKSREINKKVYECVYYGSLLESLEIAKVEGSYMGFEGSPASFGILQYDMWQKDAQNITEKDLFLGAKWLELKENIKKFGLRHSEVTALAPTVSSAIRMDNNDGFEPFTRNVFIRQSIAGSMQVINKYLVDDLINLGLWQNSLFNQIISQDGSVLGINTIPVAIQKKYRTVFELDWRTLVDMQVDRSPFVSQSSSFNHYTSYQEASPTTFTQKILYSWKSKLKTLSYYMHTETATTAKKEFGITADWKKNNETSINNTSVDNLAKLNQVKIPEFTQFLDQKTPQKEEFVAIAGGTACDMTEGCEACGV